MEQARLVTAQLKRMFPEPKESIPPQWQELLDRLDKLEKRQ